MKAGKALAAAMLFLGLLACGGRIDSDRSSNPDYAHVMGSRFKTKKELLILRYKKGMMITPFGGGDYPTRSEVKPPFPMKWFDIVILGTLPKGSEFKVVRVKYEGSSSMAGTYYVAEITDSSDSRWLGKEAYAELINSEEVPKFNPEYVEEVPK